MNYDNKTLEKSLENLVKLMLMRREIYATLEKAMVLSSHFGGKIPWMAIHRAHCLLQQLIREEMMPFYAHLEETCVTFCFGSNGKSAEPCSLLIRCFEQYQEIVLHIGINADETRFTSDFEASLNEIQLENFKEMLGLTKS